YFQYDARGLRSETHALVGSGVGDNWYYFQYDGVGRTISSCQTAASDVRYWNYDAGGRMTGEHQPSGWVDSGYDKADRRTYMLDTSDSVTYHNYDRRGLVTSVIDPSAQVITTTRDARGAEIKRELPNGTVSYMNYDLAGQSTSVLHRKSGGDVPIAMYYTYDDDGKPTQRVGVHGALDWTTYYAYDGAGRLTREHWVDDGDATMHAFTWQYDDAGNRIAMTTADATTYYDFNTLNQLTRLDEDGTDTYFEYTTDGQLEVQNSVAQETYFEWYFDGALRKVVDQTAGVDHLHEYDDSAKRWRDGTVGESTRTDFIYDGEKVLETHDYSDNVMASYVHAGPGIMQPLLAQTKSEATEWVLSDSMGSTLGLIDSDEALTLSLLYDAWGNELLDSGAGSTPYRYIGAHGYHLDDHSGLSYLWNRYYDRGVGRFASRDPLEDLVNKYWYVSARPTWSVDPRGEAEPTWPDPNSPPTGNKHKEPYIPVEPPAIPLPLGMEETGPWDWMPGLGSDSVVAPIAVGAGAVVVGGHYVHWRATGFSKCWWDCTNSVWNVWSVTTNSFVNSLIRAGLILGIGKLIGVRLSAIVFAATSRACTVYCDIKWVLDDIKGPIP
ncbi:MAG TPA: RHS repeat-associated core domain-containing protein, partial [Armatimonadota bacterium]|nr:RHS repeat-associated core domain-containing protein [Armatimonadota bacterium]